MRIVVYCKDCNEYTFADDSYDKGVQLNESSEHFNHNIDKEDRIDAHILQQRVKMSKMDLTVLTRKNKKNIVFDNWNKVPPLRSESRFLPKVFK